MIRIENISINEREAGNSRRDFLKGMLGAGAFVLGVSVMPEQLFAAPASGAAGDPFPPSEKAPLQPSVYLAIGTDGTPMSSRTARRWGMECAPLCRESLRMNWTRTGRA